MRQAEGGQGGFKSRLPHRGGLNAKTTRESGTSYWSITRSVLSEASIYGVFVVSAPIIVTGQLTAASWDVFSKVLATGVASPIRQAAGTLSETVSPTSRE